MKINQHNYEYYFLMYIDQELSEHEKAEVIEFISQHPNYAKAFQALQKTNLNPPEIIFEDKFSLYQISENDTQCLTYLDNEMPKIERKSFEKKLTSDPFLYSTLNQWRKSILINEAPNKIDTEFKNTLYKKEAIIKPMGNHSIFKQWALAAAILVLIIGVNQFIRYNNIKNDSFTFNSNTNRGDLSKTKVTNKSVVSTTPHSENTIILNTKIKRASNAYVQLNEQNKNSKSNSFIIKNVALDNQDLAIESLSKEALSTKADDEIITLNKEISPTTFAMVNEEMKNNTDETMPTQIQYNNINTEEEDRTINIGMLEIDGASLRGITRKFATLIKRNKLEKEK